MSAEFVTGTVQFGDEEPAEMQFVVQQRPGMRPNVLVPLDHDLADGDAVTFRFDWSTPALPARATQHSEETTK